jgi:hypothetical protein
MKVEIDGKYILKGVLQEFDQYNRNRNNGRIYPDNLFIEELRRWVMSNRRSKIREIWKKDTH